MVKPTAHISSSIFSFPPSPSSTKHSWSVHKIVACFTFVYNEMVSLVTLICVHMHECISCILHPTCCATGISCTLYYYTNSNALSLSSTFVYTLYCPSHPHPLSLQYLYPLLPLPLTLHIRTFSLQHLCPLMSMFYNHRFQPEV